MSLSFRKTWNLIQAFDNSNLYHEEKGTDQSPNEKL